MATFARNILLGGLLLSEAVAWAQRTIDWDIYSPQTVIAGTGCQKDVDAFASENGNDLAIVFTRLGVDLPGGTSSQLADRRNCTVRIPATISRGQYIAQLIQRISYGVTKTARTQGSIATRSTFFGFNVSPYAVTVPYGRSINNPLMVSSRSDMFSVSTTPSWYGGWCSGSRSPRGLYQANLAVAGQRDHRMEDLIMFVDGLDLKFEVVASLAHCGV